jgi:hypothetical protein
METLDRLAQFRQQIYQTFTQRSAALLELIDAVAQTPRPHSPAERSLAMQRHWTSLYDALRHGEIDLDKLRPLLVKTAATAASYRVAGCRVVLIDHTGFPRPMARTVAERERYHGPNSTLPIGHRYSWLSQVVDPDTAWVAPLDVARIGPDDTPISIALTQVKRLVTSSCEPLLLVGDREYGVDEVLRVVPHLEGAKVTWSARVRSNLVFYLPPPPRQPGQKGRARLYGARVQLNDPTTWPEPAWSATETTPSGACVEVRGWRDWRRRGLAEQPLQVVQVRVLRADGQPKYQQPLWVMLVGDEVEWARVAPRDGCRWREETWHGQAKDVLGWTRAQLGDVKRQDRWTWVVLLAGWQLLLAREVARDCPRPWERAAEGVLPLARVQRDYGRIVREFGLRVAPPKPRGKAPGRRVGTRLEPKARQPLLKRGQKAA